MLPASGSPPWARVAAMDETSRVTVPAYGLFRERNEQNGELHTRERGAHLLTWKMDVVRDADFAVRTWMEDGGWKGREEMERGHCEETVSVFACRSFRGPFFINVVLGS